MTETYFEILRAGTNSSIQDQGRKNLYHIGITISGAMDQKIFKLSNALVNNNLNEGVIEFAYQGPLLKLTKGKTKFAITGNVLFQIINSKNETINGECNRSYDLDEGDQIDILATRQSAYGYLSVEGGFDVAPFCNSVSTLVKANIGPNEGKKINIKNKIPLKTNREGKNNYTVNVSFEEKNIIRVLKGPQFDYFSESSKKEFFSKEYKITNLTDRMGMRLEGKILKNIVSTNIRSEGITKGAIQVPADGQPIVLLTDHPTIGGYPKIANVISADYDLLVQKIPGTNISFKCIELQEAEKLYKEWCSNISKIVKNIKKIK